MKQFLGSKLFLASGALLLIGASVVVTAFTYRAFVRVAQESSAIAELRGANELLKESRLVEATFRAGVAVGYIETPVTLTSAAEIAAATRHFELADELVEAAKKIAKDSDRAMVEVVERRIDSLKSGVAPESSEPNLEPATSASIVNQERTVDRVRIGDPVTPRRP